MSGEDLYGGPNTAYSTGVDKGFLCGVWGERLSLGACRTPFSFALNLEFPHPAFEGVWLFGCKVCFIIAFCLVSGW
jgi:hypothetical protein